MDHLLHRTANESTYYAPPPRKSLLRTTTNCYYRKPPDPAILYCNTVMALDGQVDAKWDSCVSGQPSPLPHSARQCKQPIMSRVACSGNVDFWRAEFCDEDKMHLPMGAHHAVWTAPTVLPCRHQWHLPHFESLPHFWVWCTRGTGGVVPIDWGPVLERMNNVSVLETTTANMSLLAKTQKSWELKSTWIWAT